MRYHLLFAALLALLGFGLTASADASKPAPDRDVQDVVYLGDKGPVLIRFHVSIDGKPLVDVWEGYIGKIFDYLDVNGDGVLDKEEAARVPPAQVLFNNAPGFRGQIPNARGITGKNKDGKITRAELANWYRSNGAAPFQFRMGGQPQNQFAVQFAGQPQPLSADALNEKLFALLDTNKDGKLSRDELARAPAVLQKLDTDDDEMISIQEMSGNVETSIEGKAVIAASFAREPVHDVPFLMVSPGLRSKKLGRELLNHYTPRGKRSAVRKLTRQDLGVDEATFARLDVDKDGTLDTEELDRFAQRAPDLEFQVRLGKNAGKAAVELIQRKDRSTPLAKSVRPGAGGTLLLEFGTTQIELGLGSESSGDPRFARLLRTQYLAQFRNADRDNNGYVDKKEAEQNPLYRNLFRMMDRDGDGKLYEKEVIAYLDKMKELQEGAMRSFASLAVKDQGRGLFDLIDSNSDSRLSVRELRQMVKLIDQLDRDGDGQLSRAEIPHKYRVDVRPGPANGNQFLPRAVALRRLGTNQPPLPNLKAGPQWFRKMDRNHDGDVSRREFLGTDEEFRRIDTDGDGLISVEEANRADKLFRTEKERKP